MCEIGRVEEGNYEKEIKIKIKEEKHWLQTEK